MSDTSTLQIHSSGFLNRQGKWVALVLLYYGLDGKGNTSSLGVIRENLNALRERTGPSSYVDLCSNLPLLSRLQVVRTGHGSSASSGGNHPFDHQFLVSRIREIKSVLQSFSLGNRSEVIILCIEDNGRFRIGDCGKQEEKSEQNHPSHECILQHESEKCHQVTDSEDDGALEFRVLY